MTERKFRESFERRLRKLSDIIIPTAIDEYDDIDRDPDSLRSRFFAQKQRRPWNQRNAEDILVDTLMTSQTIRIGDCPNGPIRNIQQLVRERKRSGNLIHPIFCEMLVLDETVESQWIWKESARWVKYEETVEKTETRFSKPHITSLNIQSILQIRNCLKYGSSLLNVGAENLKEVIDLVMLAWASKFRISQRILVKLELALIAPKQHLLKNQMKVIQDKSKDSESPSVVEAATSLEDITRRSFTKANQNLLKKLAPESESAVILIGQISELTEPVTEFVRLRDAQLFPTLTELPINVRFIFILMTPTYHNLEDVIEIGKCMGAMMVDEVFTQVAYEATNSATLADGVEEFLSTSVIFPPGKWNPAKRLEPQYDTSTIEQRNVGKAVVQTMVQRPEISAGDTDESIRRTGRIFGGFVKDIKRKAAWYPSDFLDVFKGQISQSVAAALFLYFANLTNIITFGGVMGQLLDGYMGTVENLVAGGFSGIVYALFAGQPLCILSATGPILAFEVILYEFCINMEWTYMAVRFWVGIWTSSILLVIVAFDLSVIVAVITRFTQEAFATLIAIIFIVNGFKELIALRHQIHIPFNNSENSWCLCNNSETLTKTNWTAADSKIPEFHCNFEDVFMFSILLFLGTFVIAFGLKKFRNSPYLSTYIRHTVSDFNVLIAVVLMTGLSIFVGLDVQGLNVPSAFKPTRAGRSWIIDPFDTKKWWVVFAAAGPACFLSILVFMDQQITSVIINRPDNKLKKGYGYHLDLFVLAILISICALFGLPYFASATVKGIMHVDALRQLSETAAPGEKPMFFGIHEQRMTALIAHILIALSILLTSVARVIPMPVLLGIFLYMGVVALINQQLFHRLLLLFMPIKYQPDFRFLRLVKLSRINFFTLIQLAALAMMFAVKTIKSIAMEFPLMLVVTVLIRFALNRVFTQQELVALDDPLPELKSLFKPISSLKAAESFGDTSAQKA